MQRCNLLQSAVSHDPSEIILICWFAAQETFLDIINVENNCVLLNIFVKTVIFFFCDTFLRFYCVLKQFNPCTNKKIFLKIIQMQLLKMYYCMIIIY